MADYKLLSSNKYRKGMKWLQVPENKIDTVVFNPISNTFTESEIVAEETFDTVTSGGSSISLPCSTSSSVDVSNPSYNSDNGTGGQQCKGNAFMKKARITHTFNLENPVAGTPIVRVILNGKTRKTARGSIGYGSMPNYDASSSSVASFIDTNKNGDDVEWSGDSELRLYSNNYIYVCSWIKNYRGYGDSTPENILTKWHGQPTSGFLYFTTWPEGKYWNAYNSSDKIQVYPNPYYEPLDSELNKNPYVYINRKKYEFVLNVTRINGRRFSIDIEIPIMFIYTAAARMGSPSAGDHMTFIDSFAAYDLITSVQVQLIGTTLDDSTTTRSYSLDAQGEITDNAKNKAPFTFNKNELITLSSMYGLNNWMTTMGKYILTEYKTGKYVIEADVDARYIIENDIKINTPLKVKNLLNEYICRGDRVCLFEVKTIEKKYKDGSFVYSIKALEASYSTVDIGGIGLIYNFTIGSDPVVLERSHRCVYINSTTTNLELTEDEETAQESGFELGNGITLVSTNTKTGTFLCVPGSNIGRKILIILQTERFNYPYETYHPEVDAVLYCEYGDYLEKSTYYFIRNNSKQSDYFVFLMELDDVENPYVLYFRFNTVFASGSPINMKSIQVYNAGNINLTEQEAYEWLVEHNKLI